MRRTLVITLLLVALPSSVLGRAQGKRAGRGRPQRAPVASAEQELKRLERQLFDAVIAKDVAAIDRLYAADFVSTDQDGAVVDKAQVIAGLKAGRGPAPDAVEIDDARLRVYGTTAVVTGRSTYLTGRKVAAQVRHTQVWVKRAGRWQLVSWQGTPILKPGQNLAGGSGMGNEATAPSGLKYTDLVEGTGASPQPGRIVVVHYTGTLENGTKFDSSLDRGQPFEFTIGVGRVIKGWDEGVMSMKVGGKRRLVIPPNLGYGSRGVGPIPPNSTLVFEVELLDVK